MRVLIVTFFLSFGLSFSQNQYHIYFNEIRADDESTDDIEFIELIGPAGLDLTGFTIIHYNGSTTTDTDIWQHTIGTFIIPDDGIVDDQGSALGFYVLSAATVTGQDETLPGSIQNGPDGLVLYDAENNILDAIAWEGVGDLTVDDPGTVSTAVSTTNDNYLHLTIDDDALDNSLQAPGMGYADNGSGWLLGAATPGTINFNQVNGDISLPVELTSFTVTGKENHICLRWETASEMENAGFKVFRSDNGDIDFFEISSFRYNMDLIGLGNSSTGKVYIFDDQDPTLIENITYYYKIADVDYSGKINFFGPVAATLTEKTIVQDSPNSFIVHQNYPNPFNPSTSIRISLDKPVKHAEVDIFDIAGRMIKNLYSGPISAVSLNLTWDGMDMYGSAVATGCYLYRYRSGKKVILKKMTLIR